ncbi:hypothetical protein [Sphingomonas sp. RIT328]|uniref:hypothetical protein n=1 Tax=Sphingomonas sp. RIT328 TaxID=1470591 RepID=UPI00068E5132|nr:hypothetical protein [Sphingomonas sp. RIT328]
MAIEINDDGLIVLVFKAIPDDDMFGLVQALPVRSSAKINTVLGDRPPFTHVPTRELNLFTRPRLFSVAVETKLDNTPAVSPRSPASRNATIGAGSGMVTLAGRVRAQPITAGQRHRKPCCERERERLRNGTAGHAAVPWDKGRRDALTATRAIVPSPNGARVRVRMAPGVKLTR